MITLFIIVIVGSLIVVFILAPFIAIISLASEKVCPYCKKRIPKEATVCSYCQKEQKETKQK